MIPSVQSKMRSKLPGHYWEVGTGYAAVDGSDSCEVWSMRVEGVSPAGAPIADVMMSEADGEALYTWKSGILSGTTDDLGKAMASAELGVELAAEIKLVRFPKAGPGSGPLVRLESTVAWGKSAHTVRQLVRRKLKEGVEAGTITLDPSDLDQFPIDVVKGDQPGSIRIVLGGDVTEEQSEAVEIDQEQMARTREALDWVDDPEDSPLIGIQWVEVTMPGSAFVAPLKVGDPVALVASGEIRKAHYTDQPIGVAMSSERAGGFVDVRLDGSNQAGQLVKQFRIALDPPPNTQVKIVAPQDQRVAQPGVPIMHFSDGAFSNPADPPHQPVMARMPVDAREYFTGRGRYGPVAPVDVGAYVSPNASSYAEFEARCRELKQEARILKAARRVRRACQVAADSDLREYFEAAIVGIDDDE